MKKLTALLLATAMTLSLAACGGGGNTSTPSASKSAPPAASNPASSAPAGEDRPYYVRDASEVTGTITVYTTIGETEQDALKSLWNK